MRFLKAFGRFWYDFIIGDDWKIAASVIVALAVTAGVMIIAHARGADLSPFALLGAALILGGFVISLVIDSRPTAAEAATESDQADV